MKKYRKFSFTDKCLIVLNEWEASCWGTIINLSSILSITVCNSLRKWLLIVSNRGVYWYNFWDITHWTPTFYKAGHGSKIPVTFAGGHIIGPLYVMLCEAQPSLKIIEGINRNRASRDNMLLNHYLSKAYNLLADFFFFLRLLFLHYLKPKKLEL